MHALITDVRFALRQLRKHLGFSVTAILTLAIGIGSATAVFSLVNAVLLEPVPLPHPERLLAVETTMHARSGRMAAQVRVRDNNSWLDFFDWRSGARSFAAMGGYHNTSGNLGRAGEPLKRTTGLMVSAGMTDVLGIRPELGRDLRADEELAGNRSIVLSDALWHSAFNATPDVLGKQLTLNEETYTIVGVLPRGFQFPGAEEATYWVSMAHDREGKNAMATQRGWHGMTVVGRLRAGVAADAAAAELDSIQGALAKQYPDTNANNDGVAVETLGRHLTGEVRQPLRILLAAVGFLLLIACVNVAGLLLTRAIARQGELAVRAALGASRPAIVRQLLIEAVTVSLAGGALGTLLASALLRIAPYYLPEGLPHASGIAMNVHVLGFALAASVVTGLLFGVLPAWRASRLQPAAALSGNARGVTLGRGRHHMHAALVVSETALSLLMLVGAGLMLRSFHRVLTVDAGFDTKNLLTFRVAVPAKHFTDPQELQFIQQLQAKLAALPGAKAATCGFPLPLAGGDMSISFDIPSHPVPPSQQPAARTTTVAANFFSTMRTPMLRGRAFTEAEDRVGGAHVLVVNQAFADRFFPGEDALGKHVRPGLGESEDPTAENGRTAAYEIVGITGNSKRVDLTEASEPEYFVPISQALVSMPAFALRTSGDPMQSADTVRRVVAEIDHALPVFSVYSYDRLLERNTAMRRFQTILLTGFAAVALLLAAIGLYASLSYMVVERTPELGLRMALGSQRADVLALVMRRGVMLAVAGLGIGLVAAAALTRYVSSLLYDVRALDAVTFAGTALLLFAVCALSSFVPAVRASRLNPIDTLRQQ